MCQVSLEVRGRSDNANKGVGGRYWGKKWG